MRWIWLLLALMLATGRSEVQLRALSRIEFERSRGPANATTLRQFYRDITALTADPALNGSLTLVG